MKRIGEIVNQQKNFTASMVDHALLFAASLDTSYVTTVLLSGSVARGDFWPGRFGGLVDLTVFGKPGSNASCEELFGPDEEPDIPYHCVTRAGAGFQIDFLAMIGTEDFARMDEAKKSALLESRILLDCTGEWAALRRELEPLAEREIAKLMDDSLGYAGYLLSDYKKDRWERRDAYPQLQENLDTAVRLAVRCLYYANGRYAPAEDRRLYYSFGLENLPAGYEALMRELGCRDLFSLEDYRRRERLFNEELLPFLKDSHP